MPTTIASFLRARRILSVDPNWNLTAADWDDLEQASITADADMRKVESASADLAEPGRIKGTSRHKR